MGYTKDYIWVDGDGKGGWKVPRGKGQRLIVVCTCGVKVGMKGHSCCLNRRQTRLTTMKK